MSKRQTEQVISLALSVVVALLAIFGYHVLVVQPVAEDALEIAVEVEPAVDVARGALNVGASGLSVVVSPGEDVIVEIGANTAITSTSVTPSAVTTVTAYGCQVTSPAMAGAWECVSSISGNTLTFQHLEPDKTPVVTPVGASTWFIAGY